jgi:copper chaperone NosL
MPFQQILDRSLSRWSRLVLAALVIPLALAYTAPIWRIHLVAPQYPAGLTMDIWTYKVVGGDDGQHIQEINTLNHYIGMSPIDRKALSDLDWIPFALAVLGFLALRVAAIGNVRSLVDLAVLASFFVIVSGGRFVYMLYSFGHNLAPDAPVTIDPFMPVVVGTKQIANFTTSSYPLLGSFHMGAFIAGVVGVTLWQLVAFRRRGVLA